MKKKIISLLTAAILVASMGTTVFAVGSPSAGEVTQPDPDKSQTVKVEKVENVKAPEEYVTPEIKENTKAIMTDKTTGEVKEVQIIVEPVGETTVGVTAQETANQLANIDKIAEDIANGEQVTSIAKDPTKKIVPEIQTMINVRTENIEVTEGNPITLTFPVAGVKAGDAILILHYAGKTKGWETIAPDIVGEGTVTATFTSLSPIAIVKLTVAEAEQSGTGLQNPPQDPSQNPSQDPNQNPVQTPLNGSATETTKISPKTGWSLF